MNLGQLKINVTTEVTDEFTARAKDSFPNETFAYLVGKYVTPDHVEVTKIIVPENVDAHCSPAEVDVQDKWLKAAKRKAKSEGLVVVGDIHSHPYSAAEIAARRPHKPDTSPSESDLERSLCAGPIMAICLVTESKAGRLTARIRFWSPMNRIQEVVSE